MSNSVREAFEREAKLLGFSTNRTKAGYYMTHKLRMCWGLYQSATAAADAEWRGVVEKLVEALEYVEANYDGMNKAAIVRQALAQAEKLMGRKQ